MPAPPPAPQVCLGEPQNCVTGALAPVGRRDKRIVPMLDHARRQTCCEGLRCRVKLLQLDVATPSPHKPDCVRVDSRYQERHGYSLLHGIGASIFRLESGL